VSALCSWLEALSGGLEAMGSSSSAPRRGHRYREPGDTIGDMLGFGNDLYDAENATVVGRSQGQCFRSNPGLSSECTWTNILEDGSITVQGPFYDDLQDVDLAITGGTGAYAGASGTMTLHARDELGTEFDFTFDVRLDDDGHSTATETTTRTTGMTTTRTMATRATGSPTTESADHVLIEAHERSRRRRDMDAASPSARTLGSGAVLGRDPRRRGGRRGRGRR
jgi:hypothetical protein